MDLENIKKDCMKEEYSRQITSWKYDGQYSGYNLPSYKECLKNKYGITREDKKDNYTVYLLEDTVVFYLNLKPMDNNKLYIGVGLKPELCGKGLGISFLEDSCKIIEQKYPEKSLYLEVRSWNKRAIKSYEKIGFKIIGTVVSKDRNGNDLEFIEMTK